MLPNPLLRSISLVLCLYFLATSVHAADSYQLGADSQEQDVPHGRVTTGQIISQKASPGVVHKYWVYVPAQYDGSTPAAVMVFQDGGGFQNPEGSFRAPVVFDNQIAHRQMPVTIAIMIDPGVLPPADPKTQSPRAQRSFEYDSPTDRYARFLIDEVLPKIGEQYKLTSDPNLRAICGSAWAPMESSTPARTATRASRPST